MLAGNCHSGVTARMLTPAQLSCPALRAGWVAFILKLKKGYYLYQFGQFAWTHLILLFVFVPSSFFVANIFDGIIWFLLPCSLVIINDIGAYLAGVVFGTSCAQLR